MERVTSTGALGTDRARLRGLQVTSSAGAGRLTITDGAGGPVVLDLDFLTSDNTTSNIPGSGILCKVGPVVSAFTNLTAATIYYE